MKLAPPPKSFLLGDGLKIWTNPRSSPNIVVLCRGSLFVSNIDNADLRTAVDRLSAGAGPEQVFGGHLREIPLVALENVEADLRHNSFRFCYHSDLGSARDEIKLAHPHDAEELLAILRQQLGGGFQSRELGLNLFRICGLPLMILLLHGSLCVMGWLMLNPLDGIRRRSSIVERALQDYVGDNGLKMFGISVGTILVIWMLTRLIGRPAGYAFDKIKESMQ